ncbi:MAG: hypothetical protein AMJ78_07660 [Omnitrophica WOR_2 bacterium SM23_29]|nr:MAG: hypothetical protein AMJ78_07660 [Omnitrophica WOR_2 bacterium SM23_29]
MRKVICLDLWIMPNGGYETSQFMEKEIADFEQTHPNIKVNLSIIPWSKAWQRIITAAKSKELPDVFQIGNSWTKTLTAINALTDVTDKAIMDKMKNKFSLTSWATCEVQDSNKIYALPWFVDVRMLFYRKDFFEKLGLDPKELDKWESFEDVCKALTGFDFGSGQIGALGVSDLKDQGLVHDVAPWIWSNGGDFLTADRTAAAFHKERALRGIKFYFDLMQKGYAPILDRRVPGQPLYDFFTLDKYGMCITGAYVFANYLRGFIETPLSIQPSKSIEKFGVTFLPAGPIGRFTFQGGSNLSISSYSANQAEAWQLLKFLTSNEFQMHQYEIVGALPSLTETFNYLFGERTEKKKVLIESYSKYGRSHFQVDFWGSVEFILVEFFGKIIDSIKAHKYNEGFLVKEANQAAEQVNYILSL